MWATASIDITPQGAWQERRATVVTGRRVLAGTESPFGPQPGEKDFRAAYHRLLDALMDEHPRVAEGHAFSVTLH